MIRGSHHWNTTPEDIATRTETPRATVQQAQVSRDVDRNLVNIRDLALLSYAGADQTSAASQELSKLAEDLNAMASRFKI